MKKTNMNQSGEDCTTQVQSENIVVNNFEEGINLAFNLTIQDNRIIAQEKAKAKYNAYINLFLPLVEKYNLGNLFTDPEYQMLFNSTAKTVIRTERPLDYIILSGLLVKRSKSNDIEIKTSISKAVEVVDRISDDGLLVLTIMSVFDPFIINEENKTEKTENVFLKEFDDFFTHLLSDNNLPKNSNWYDNLEINNLIRISDVFVMSNLCEYLYSRYKKMHKVTCTEETEHKNIFNNLYNNCISLKKLEVWWNKNLSEKGFYVNSVGEIIGEVNADITLSVLTNDYK